MPAETWTRLAPALALAVALAATTGLRAWMPLLLAGGLARLGLLELGESYRFLSSNQALVVFAAATVLEITADKIPVLDHLLDTVSTLLRPAAGSLLAASALGVVLEPLTAAVLGVVVGAPFALLPHAVKSASRTLSTTLTAGLANPALSLIEDVLTLVLFVLAVLIPAAVVAALAVAVCLLVRRWLRRPLRAHAT